MTASISKQCDVVKFCFLLSKNEAETVSTLKTAFKDDALEETVQVVYSVQKL